MDSTLIAGILTAIATVIAVILAWYLQRPKASGGGSTSITTVISSANTEASNPYARRYIEHSSHHRFIKALPKLKLIVIKNAQEGWDTGITSEMRESSYDVIDFLEYAWIRVSRFYPAKHWGNLSAEDWIREYIQKRFEIHWSKYEPDGPGTGGTIVGVMTGGDVISDLESLINDTVTALFTHTDNFDLAEWTNAWQPKANQP